MSNTLGGALEFEFDIDMGNLKQKRQAAENEIRAMTRNITNETSKIDGGFKMAFKAMAAYGIGSLLKNIAGQVISVRAEFEKMGAVLTNTLGSKSAANKALADIKEFAASTPFQVTELTSAFVKLSNQGFVPTIDSLRSLGDIAASQGKTFDQLTEAMIDASGAFEFERLKEFGIRAQKEGDKIIFTFKGQKTAIEANSEAIRNYILTLGKAQGVEGSMAAISKTSGGQISNLKDSWDSLLNTIGTKTGGATSLGIKGIKSLTDGLNDLLDTTVKISAKENISNFSSSLSRETTGLNSLFETAKKAGQGTEARKLAIEEINKIYGQYIGNLNTEKTTLEDLEIAQKKATDALIKDLAYKSKAADIEEKTQDNIDNEKKIVKDVLDLVDASGGNIAAASIRLNQMFDKFATTSTKGVYTQVMSFIKDFNLGAKLVGPEDILDPLMKVYNSRQSRDKAIKDVEAYYTAIAGVINDKATGVVDPTGGKGKGTGTGDEIKQFEEYLKKTKDLYEKYDITKAVFGIEEADNIYQKLKILGEDYYDFLLNLSQNATKAQKPALAVELQPYLDEAKKMNEPIEMDPIEVISDKDIEAQLKKDFEEVQDAIEKEVKKFDDDYQEFWKNRANTMRNITQDFGTIGERKALDLADLDKKYDDNKLFKDEKYYKARAEINNKYAKESFGNAARYIDALSPMLSLMDEKAQAAFGGFMGITESLTSGDFLGAIGGAVGLFTTLFDITGEKKREDHWRVINNYIEMANRKLTEQLSLIEKLSGEEKNIAYNKAIEQAGKDLAHLEAEIKNSYKGITGLSKILEDQFGAKNLLPIDGTIDSLQDLEDTLDRIKQVEGVESNEKLEGLIQGYKDLQEQIEQTIEAKKEFLTGNTYDDILTSIKDAFADGKLSIEEFGASFETIMKNAILNTFSQKFLNEKLKGWYEQFAQLSEDGLSSTDISQLKDSLKTITDAAQQGIEEIQQVTGINLAATDQAESSLSGAVKQIQEETANIIAGQMNAIRIVGLEQRDIAMNSFNQLLQIQHNTFRTANNTELLKDIKSILGDQSIISGRANGG